MQDKVAAVREAKTYEAQAGADGALIYDISLVPAVRQVFDTEVYEKGNRIRCSQSVGSNTKYKYTPPPSPML
jgi:hypothetical protein